MARRGFGTTGFLVRWLVAIILVFGTFNPTDWSYYSWVMSPEGSLPLKIIVGIAILILYVVYLRATWRSIGPIGILLVLAFLAAIVWGLVDQGILSLASPDVATWVILLIFATIMAVGISWAHVRKRVTGEVTTDEPDI